MPKEMICSICRKKLKEIFDKKFENEKKEYDRIIATKTQKEKISDYYSVLVHAKALEDSLIKEGVDIEKLIT